MNLSLREIADAVGGALREDHGDVRARGVSIDSRAIETGQLFVAIAGERFDGHRFAAQAARSGAAALLLARGAEHDAPADHPTVLVDDTRRALAALARFWRDRVAPTVIGLTGSVGKTTTKELLASILRASGARTHATRGNFNNDIGLPLTLLAMPEGTRFVVAEMGMNAPGEIAALCEIARPDVGLITNIAPVHLEGLGSLEAIADAKAELLDALGESGVAVIPDDAPLLSPHVAHIAAHRAVTFGDRARSGVRIVAVEPRGEAGSDVTLSLGEGGEQISLRLPLVGRHNARNAAAAAAAALALDIASEAIARGLGERVELSHRSAIRHLGDWRVLDDCYNASPRAVEAALAALVDLAADDDAPAIAVLGEMRELGDESNALHRAVGRAAAKLPLAALFVVGDAAAALAEGARASDAPFEVIDVPDAEEAAARLSRWPGGGWLLVKASRGAALERVIEALEQQRR